MFQAISPVPGGRLLLKLGDFVVGSQELLVTCGLDHVVIVRNLLQLGLADCGMVR